jgi:hypothetical protein
LEIAPPVYADADPTTPQILDIAGTGGNDRLAIVESQGMPHVWLNGVDRGQFWPPPTSSGGQTVRINTARGNDVITVETALLAKLLVIYGGGGDDVIFGSIGAERIVGGDGNDVIVGGDGRDTIYGEGGDDSIRGAGGSDLIDGGDGFDTLRGDAGHDNIAGGASRDRVRGSDGNDRIEGGGGNDLLGGEEGLDFIDGGAGDDVVAGGGGNDTLIGGRGNDSLTGETGDDDCSGGGGADNVSGGAGNDYYHTTPADGGDLDAEHELSDTAIAPTAVAAVNNKGTAYVNITWQYPAEAEVENFETEQSEDGGETWTHLFTHEGDDRSAALFVSDSRTHLFRVRALDDAQPSEYGVSNPLAIPPLGALNLSASPLFTGGLAVTWVDLSSSEDRFELFMRTGTAAFAKVATIDAEPDSGEVVTHNLPDLAANTEYDFFVRTVHESLGVNVDSEVYWRRTDPARINIEYTVEVAPDEPFTLPLKLTGMNASLVKWVVDFDDGSPIITIEPGATPEQLTLTHSYRGREYPTAHGIGVTATGPGVSEYKTQFVMVAARE